jgi:hypothetical protein
MKFSASVDSITDKQIYRRAFFDLIAELYTLNRFEYFFDVVLVSGARVNFSIDLL